MKKNSILIFKFQKFNNLQFQFFKLIQFHFSKFYKEAKYHSHKNSKNYY